MQPSTVYCDNCGAANRPQAGFCIACGQAMAIASSLPSTGQVAPIIPSTQPTVLAGAPSSSASLTGLLPTNSLLKQRYLILSRLGQGGMGAVYKAADTQLGDRLVAVKEMSQKGLDPQELAEATAAFKREAHMLAGLPHHLNLPSIYDHFGEGGRWYLVMDFIAGETLEDYLPKAGGKLLVEEVLDIGIQLCTVLGYLHSHQPPIIFRDLKPANVMRMANGQLYLIDFGIARHFKQGQSKDTIAYGSAGYAAPEQYGKAQTTLQSDIYSLGATLHHLLSGSDPSQSPFVFAPLPGANVPAELAMLIMRMVQTQANQRPASMAEVKQELQRLAAQSAVVVPPIVNASPPSTPVQPFTPNMPAKTKEHWLNEGEAHLNAYHYEDAIGAFEQALRLDPDNASAYRGKGAALLSLGRSQEALAVLEQALRLEPNNAKAYTFKGATLLTLGRNQEALAVLEQALRLGSTFNETHRLKGFALINLGRNQEALAALEEALRLYPNNAEAHWGKGIALVNLGRNQEALTAFEQALRLDPSEARVYKGKSMALSNLQRYQEALVALDQAISFGTNEPAWVYGQKGYVLIELKGYQEALVALDQAIRLDPNNGWAYGKKGYALYELKRYQETLVALDQALRLDPNNGYAYSQKGDALYELNRYQEALTAYEQALRLDPNNGRIYYNKGCVLERLNRNREARQAFDMAKRLGYEEYY